MENANEIIKKADLEIKRMEKIKINDRKFTDPHELFEINFKLSELLRSMRTVRTTIYLIIANAKSGNTIPDIGEQLVQLNELLNEFEIFIKENKDKIIERRKFWQVLKW